MFKKYLLKEFAASFLSVFVTLLIIASVIIMFQIAKVTSYVQLDISELFKLYLLMSVKLLIFTVPISFFLALGGCFKKLCTHNEVIILFALGLSPLALARFASALGAAFSAALCAITIYFIPASFNLYDNFIDYKKTIANISLKTGNYGQAIGEWVYHSREQNGIWLKDISLINTKTFELVFARSGRVFTKDANAILRLQDVSFYSLFEPEVKLAKLKELELKNQLNEIKSANESVLEYWSDYKSRSKELVIYLCLSLLPLASSLWVLGWAIVHERVQKSHLYAANFVYLSLYFVPIAAFSSWHFYTICTSFALFWLLGAISFWFKMKRF